MPTIAKVITEGAALLKASAVADERPTAGALLCHVLGIDRTQLLISSAGQITDADYATYLEFVARRVAGEPLQYITGHQEFYGLEFVVTPDVLIPRPETEFLVERVIKLAGDSAKDSPLIVDLGTGSGCIVVTLAVHLPHLRFIATDISAVALEVARANAERHQVADRIEFVEGDGLEPLSGLGLEGALDVIASNPPYVEEASSQLIQREVRDWEPHAALFAGADGLDFYRRVIPSLHRYLKPEAFVVLEIGYSQLDAISSMIAGSKLELVDTTPDLQGIPRTVCLRRVG